MHGQQVQRANSIFLAYVSFVGGSGVIAYVTRNPPFLIFNIRVLCPERQSARMSKIKKWWVGLIWQSVKP